MSTISISVAGTPVRDISTVIRDYLLARSRTINRFDRIAGSSSRLTPALVGATRVVNSRISKAEERWFLERDEVSPPTAVLPHTMLDVSFAPDAEDTNLDAVARLWLHYLVPHRDGVSWSKVSKCLYLLRPGLYPILDSRLCAKYRPMARRLSPEVRGVDGGKIGIAAFWAAVQRDLTAASGALTDAREAVAREQPELGPNLDALTDLRLLDICAWEA